MCTRGRTKLAHAYDYRIFITLRVLRQLLRLRTAACLDARTLEVNRTTAHSPIWNSHTFLRRRRNSREISSVVAPAECAVGRARNNYLIWLAKKTDSVDSSQNFSRLIIIYSTTWQRRTPSLCRTLQMWWVVIVKASVSCSSLAVVLIASSTLSKKVTSLKQLVAFLW